MAVAFVQHSIGLRLAVLPTQQAIRRPLHLNSSAPRFDATATSSSSHYLPTGDEALEAQVRNADAPEPTALVALPDDVQDSESDAEESPPESTLPDSANEPLGAAASLVPGRTYGRLKINLDLLLHKTKQFQRRKRKRDAEAILRECIRDWPDDGRAYVALGQSLAKSGKMQEARKLYDDGCQAARGENPYIWQAWAVLEERAGNISKARDLFDAATAADRRHAAAWHGWAVLELRNKNLKKARTLLLKGLKFCGDNEYLYQTLAIIAVRIGEIEQARSYFSKATRVNVKSAASWLAWALMEAEFGVKDLVRRLFQRGLQAVPRNGYIWQAWARFEAKEGNKGRARELFKRGAELNPKDVVILQAYALFEYDCGQVEIAHRHFRRAVLIDAKHQPLWLAWGWVEWKEGNLQAAREYYRKSLTINNRNMNAVRTYQAWGVLEGKDDNYAAARALFRSALRVDSQNMPAWLSWAAMEERCGNAVRAEELKNQCFQQRTEVVEQVSWDLDVSELLAPTIEGLAGLLVRDRRSKNKEDESKDPDKGEVDKSGGENDDNIEGWENVDDFDIDAFLHEKFPWKYKKPQDQQPRQKTKARESEELIRNWIING